MKKTRKGFTLVELLVVIAIVAILATVAIIGYTSFTKKAEKSADQQAVTQMNTALADLKADATIDDVIAALIANGYNGDLTTYYSNYSLAKLNDKNVIVLVENGAVVYPEDYAGQAYTLLNRLATDADSLTAGLAAGKVHMNGNVTVDGLAPEATGTYEVVLNGNTLNASQIITSNIAGSTLVVSNGIIDGTTIPNPNGKTSPVTARTDGHIELNNVQVYGAEDMNPIKAYGGTLVLNNVTAAQHGENAESWFNSAVQVVNYLEQIDGKWTILNQANVTITGGMYTGDKAVQIDAPGGNVTINSGVLSGETYVINADFAPQNYGAGNNFESVITINGGTLNGNIKISAATELVINGGTFKGETFRVGNTTVALTVEALAPYVTAGSTIVVNGVSFTK